MEALGTSSVRVGKIEGPSLGVLFDTIRVMVEDHPRGILDFATIEEVMESIANGSLQIWGAGNAVELKLLALTTISMFKKKSALFVTWIGGTEFSTYGPQLLDVAEKWCAMNGVQEIQASATPGWGRRLGKLGFIAPRVELVKAISYVKTEDGQLARKD